LKWDQSRKRVETEHVRIESRTRTNYIISRARKKTSSLKLIQKKALMKAVAVALLAQFLATTDAFVASNHSPRPGTAVEASRREILASGGAFSALVATTPAFADISDGNQLPDGALQFSRLLKVKTDLTVSDELFSFAGRPTKFVSQHIHTGGPKPHQVRG